MPRRSANDDASGPVRSRTPFVRVLVVGENENVRRWASRRLRMDGFTVQTTGSGIDAMVLASGDPPDLMVVDQVVGWMDVRYLLTLLKHDPHTASIPVLLITRRTDDALNRACQRLGATPVVRRDRKPVAISTREQAHRRQSGR